MHNNNNNIERSFGFINNIRGYHADNSTRGEYDDLIASTIIQFAETQFIDLIQICLEEDDIAAICNLSIPSLTRFWKDYLIKLSINSINSITNQPFVQILNYFFHLSQTHFH